MTTTEHGPRMAFGAVFPWRSLKTRVTVFTLAIFLLGIWSLAFYASLMLRHDMERLLGEQQFSTVSLVATEINSELESRLRALEKAAARITPATLGKAASMQKFLEDRPALGMMFSAGIYVTRLDGIVIADSLVAVGRIGGNYLDRDYIAEALKGKTIIGKPVMGKKLHAPAVVLSAPVRDAEGNVIGVLAGGINLGLPNFMDKIPDGRYGRTGGYLLAAPQHKLFITATDKSRIMQPLPAAGINPMHDRYMQGFEGFGISVNSRGIEELSAAKQIPVAGWFAVAVLPTQEAFTVVNSMQQRMLLATFFLTLLAGGLTWWMLKHQLAPILTTIKTLAALSDTNQPPQPLPITSQDEIGQLIGGFNSLLETLGKREDALKESEKKHRMLFDSAGDSIFIHNDSGMLAVNPTTCERLGYSHAELMSMPTGAVDTPDQGRHVPARLAQLKERGHLTFETVHRRKDGSLVPTEVNARLITWEGEPAVMSICRDITERKKAEEIIGAANRRLRLHYTQSPLAMIEWDMDFRVALWNPAAEVIFGFTESEAMGQQASFILTDEVRSRVNAIWDALIHNTGGGSSTNENMRSDGSVIQCEWYNTPLVDNEGVVIGVSSLIQDVTEKRKLEDQLRQAQKMESIGILAGGVAHDFNNILTAIIGYGHIALLKTPKDAPQRLHIEHMLEACDRAAHLTQDLLLFSRKQRSNRKPVNLNGIIRKVEKFLVRVIGEDIDCRTRLSEEAMPVLGDEHQLEQVLMNLATNARDAMSAGGAFTITTERVKFNEEFSLSGYGRPGDYVLTSISDTGTGMDAATQQHIFDPFFTTKEVGKGTGLGLAVVYGIIKQHEGFITVYSEPRQGTTFKIYLPLISAGVEEDIQQVEERPAGGTEAILLAEDDETVRTLTTTVLKEFGYTVIAAVDGQDAVDKYKENRGRIMLLLFDIIMPKKNGKEAYDEIRALQPDIKILFQSGYAPDLVRQKVLLDAKTPVMYKPGSPSELLKQVRSVLDKV